MKSTRIIGAAAVALGVSGCATGPMQQGAGPAMTTPSPAQLSANRAEPRAQARPEQSAPAPMALPAPRPVALERRVVAQTPRPAPLYEPLATTTDAIAAAEVAAPPRPEPPMVELGALDALIEHDAAAPLYEPAPLRGATGSPAAPVYAAPIYVESAPIPESAQELTTRAMAPIYDDPVDPPRAAADNPEQRAHARKAAYRPSQARSVSAPAPTVRNHFTPDFGARLERAAIARLNPNVRYDARYVQIGYPWGDVPESTGVCTDVVIRAYRALGVDLQQLVHEDMRRAFVAYPSRAIYGLREADPNIDHRRVVNLEAFFERVGAAVPISDNPDDYLPGDIVTWRLSGNEPHIGIVISRRDPSSGNPLVVHNMGAGVKADDMLFLSPQTGHYRFAPDMNTMLASLAAKRARKDG